MVLDLETVEHNFDGRFHTLEVEIAAPTRPCVTNGIDQGLVKRPSLDLL